MQNLDMNRRHLVTTIFLSFILGASTFSYKDAKNWGKEYPKCKGKNQSPVILMAPPTNDEPLDVPLMGFPNIGKLPKKMTMKNTGHTVEIKANWSGDVPKVTGLPLNGTYVFEKITFHWAQDRNKKGAEHTVHYADNKDPKRSDMEMHIFFYRTDLKSFEKAESEKDGLAVFAVFLDSTVNAEVTGETKILEKSLNKVQSINSTAVISPFKLRNLLNNKPTYFLFYKGSLDYPPCSESVNWFIFETVFPTTKRLLNQFRKIKFADGDVSNVRPPQALNKRQVNYAYPSLMLNIFTR